MSISALNDRAEPSDECLLLAVASTDRGAATSGQQLGIDRTYRGHHKTDEDEDDPISGRRAFTTRKSIDDLAFYHHSCAISGERDFFK
jgi:hypothetical protein